MRGEDLQVLKMLLVDKEKAPLGIQIAFNFLAFLAIWQIALGVQGYINKEKK